MQKVSREYKQSMEKHNRNRGYIRATIGVFNSRAQKAVKVNERETNLMYISNVLEPFSGLTPEKIYATPEEDFSRVDGSMYFLPPKNTGYTLYNNGIVTKESLDSIFIDFGGQEFDIKGLTIDFSDWYPTEFTIETNHTVKKYQENNKRHWTTEDVFDKTTFFIIRPLKMVNSVLRFRIFRFSCGITNTFTNNEVSNYTEKEYVSPIAETVPSNDVSLTVFNYNLYYSPDNPESAFGYMEVGQEVNVAFGYDVSGKGDIEWLPEKTSYLKDWKANESNATFISTDIFDNISGTYYKGKYQQVGVSLYDLAEDVFMDAGIKRYFIDEYLKEIIVYNPMPVVGYAGALQIIANAGRCVLKEDRQGVIHIYPSFFPKMVAHSSNQAWYSHVENVLKNDMKDAYATASNNFSAVDGSMYFLPLKKEDVKNMGYISESIWIETKKEEVLQRLSFRLGNNIKAFGTGGYWDGEVPSIIIDLETVYTAFGVGINFRRVAPKEFYIFTYQRDELVDYLPVSNPNINYHTEHVFMKFDRMEIVFSKGYPNSRIFVDNIIIGDNTDYELRRGNELVSAPNAIRQNKIQDICVIFSSYKEGTENVVVASDEIIVANDGYEYTAHFTNPCYNLTVFVNTNEEGAVYGEIIECSNYYAKIKFTGIIKETIVRYSISGIEYITEEQKYIVNYNKNGEVKTWNNPLVSTLEHAKRIEEWIAVHFLGEIEYEIKWKGDPAVDANDLFHLETKFGKVFIRDYENSLSFNGRWKGNMKARKVVR